MKLFFLTGELSGESHAAMVVSELLKSRKDIQIKALGSKILEGFGVELVANYKDYSHSGFTDVVLNLAKILSLKKKIVNEIKNFKPDVLILVDFAGFNLEVAKEIRKELKETKIIEFIAPQIWASRPYRIKKIKKCVDKVLCTLPFEEKIYKEADVPVRYVGNPVASSITPAINKEEFFESTGFKNGSKPYLIGLFPGSRKSEIRAMLPVMIKAARELKEKLNLNLKFVLSQAPSISTKDLMDNGLKEVKEEGLIEVLKPSLMTNTNHKLLSSADLLWLCSGTVTLEAALYGTPYFLAYKGDWLSYQIYKMVKTIDMAGLANIIAGKYIVPEFLQYDATAENFVKQTLLWLNEDGEFSPEYYNIQKQLLDIRDKLSELDTEKLVAEEILKISKDAKKIQA